MEPISAWIFATVVEGCIANRGDSLLFRGIKKLQNVITNNLHEPSNHHIQRAIRKSYLNTTLLAVDHTQKKKKRFSLTDRRWDNLQEIKDHLKKKIDLLSEEIMVRDSPIDETYRELLFPKDNTTTSEQMPELIKKLKDSIVLELESNQLQIDSELKSCIYNGWKEGRKEMDFYQLICAFFTQELKDNPQLSVFIQTEYLDQITTESSKIALKVNDLMKYLKKFYDLYQHVLGKVDEILGALKRMDQKLDDLPLKTAELINKSIQEQLITPRQITVSEEYQKLKSNLDEIEDSMVKLRQNIAGIKQAIPQVNENTKSLLAQNQSELESELLSKGTQKENLELKLTDFIENVISLAKQLQNSKELDSERLTKARALFEEGKYEEVNKVLNEKEIDEDILRYKEQGKVLANELTIKAQVILLNKPKGWFEEAERLYTKALSIIEDYNTTFNYAYFLDTHRKISKAVGIYEKNIIHCLNPSEKASTLNNLANLQSDKNEFGKAELSYLEALEIYRKLAEENPQAYLAHVATTLNNLAILQQAKNEFGKAMLSYLEALEIYRKLAEENPQAYLADVAMTLNNLANLQRHKNEFGKAELSYLEALEIYQKLAEENPHVYLADVSKTLNNLASLQHYKNEFSKSELNYLDALEIFRKLAEENPQAYLAHVAMTLDNLANLQKAKNEFGKAELSFLEALEIYRKLAEENPQVYLADVAMTLNNLAVLQEVKNEYGKAELSYLDALEIFRKLAEENPQAYLAHVAMTLNNLAILQKTKNEFGKAELSYLEALQIRRKLAEENPQAYLADFAITLNNLGNLQSDKNEFGKAELSYLEALQIRRKLAEENPQTYLADVATTLNNLAILQKTKNEFGKAELSYLEALQIRRKLAEENPQVYLADVATTLNNLGNLQSDKNEFGKAELSYLEALQIRRKLAEENPQAYLAHVATTLNNHGNLQSDKNEFGKAELSYLEALQIRGKLADENPNTFLIPFGDTCISLAIFYTSKKVDKERSIFFAQKALEAYSAFVPHIPHAVKWIEVPKKILEFWKNKG